MRRSRPAATSTSRSRSKCCRFSRLGDFSEIALERQVADVEDADVEAALDRLAEERRTYSPKPEGAKAEMHDRVTVDFVGTIKGVPFEGGEGKDIEVVLGSNTFIPGFEEQLVGVAAGEQRKVEATFPEPTPVRALAGKTGDFDVTVKAVAAPEALSIDDEFAKRPRLRKSRRAQGP